MKSFKCICFIAFTAVAALAMAQDAPRKVGPEEVYAHRIDGPPFIRTNVLWSKDTLPQPCLGVHVVVNPKGSVASATANEGVPIDSRSQAEAAVRSLRYRPFEDHSRAIVANFEECVAVLPRELKSSRNVPFPVVHDWDSVRIHLSRTVCNGECPEYSVEVRGDGSVTYWGSVFVVAVGERHGTITREEMQELVSLFRDADYYSLNDEYIDNGFDIPTYETSIEIDGRVKKVKDYGGWFVGMPMSVLRLENAIDQFAGTKQWIRGGAQTGHGKSP
jgi:hypothetical protein